MSTDPTHPPTSAARAISVMFAVNGFTFSSWMPRLPEIRDRLAIDDATLGLTLVGGGLGGLVVSLLSGWVVDRLGSRRSTVATSVVLSCLLPIVGVAGTAPVLFTSLVALGAFDGLTDASMNTQAVAVQRTRPTSIMTRFHAAWSGGAVGGGLTAGWAASAGISLRVQLTLTAVVLVGASVTACRWLVPAEPRRRRPGIDVDAMPRVRARPTVNRAFVRLFLVGVIVALAEMPPNDWASLMLADRFGLTSGRAAFGFVATSAGMLAGRLLGDRAADLLGSEPARRTSAALAVAGVVGAATGPSPWVSAAGLFVAGVGVSTLFPLMVQASSGANRSSSHGMASFSSGARLGFIVTPPLVGAIADARSTATGMLVVTGLAGLALTVVRVTPRA